MKMFEIISPKCSVGIVEAYIKHFYVTNGSRIQHIKVNLVDRMQIDRPLREMGNL